MNILICIGRLYMGGIEKYAIDLAIGLKNKGHEVSILVFFYVKNDVKKSLLALHNINLIEINLQSGHDLKLPFKFFNELKKLNPDIIHLNTIPALGTISLYLLRKPVVYTIHQMAKNKLSARLYHPVVHGVVAVSEAVKHSQFEKQGIFRNKEWEVIYNGIENTHVKKQIWNKKEEINLIMISRIAKDKHPDQAIEILHYLNQNSNLKFNLILMGDPDVNSYEYYEEIKDKIKKYSLDKNVILTGWQEDIDYYLKKSHGLLILSDSEAFPYNAIEAFSYGVPAFSYFIPGGLHEVHKNFETGVVSEKRDPVELAIKINEVFQNASVWEDLSKNAKKISSDFSLQKMTDKTEAFYNTIIKK